MSQLATCADLHSVTFSPASASGLMLCVWPDGRTTDRYGRDQPLANLSARQAKALGLLTSGTYGQPGITSLNSANLQKCLANKLQAKTALAGSTLYKLTWKLRVTPSGRQIYALRASVRRISGSDCSLLLNGWHTPVVRDHRNSSGSGTNPRDLPRTVPLASWVTPAERDWKDTAGMKTTGTNPDGNTRNRVDQLPRQAAQRGYKKGVEDAVDVIFNQEMEPSELLVWADSASNTYADQLHPSITDNKGNIPPF